MIPFLLYKGIFLKLWSKVLHILLLLSLYFSSLNLKYLKLSKLDLTRFAMKLFIWFGLNSSVGEMMLIQAQVIERLLLSLLTQAHGAAAAEVIQCAITSTLSIKRNLSLLQSDTH